MLQCSGSLAGGEAAAAYCTPLETPEIDAVRLEDGKELLPLLARVLEKGGSACEVAGWMALRLPAQPWSNFDMHHLLWEPRLVVARIFELHAETWRRSILNTTGEKNLLDWMRQVRPELPVGRARANRLQKRSPNCVQAAHRSQTSASDRKAVTRPGLARKVLDNGARPERYWDDVYGNLV